MVIGMALEIFGLGAVLPVISLMVGGDSVATEFPAPFLPQGGEDVPQDEIILFESLFLISIYFSKYTFLSYLIYLQTSHAFDLPGQSFRQAFPEIYAAGIFVFQKNQFLRINQKHHWRDQSVHSQLRAAGAEHFDGNSLFSGPVYVDAGRSARYHSGACGHLRHRHGGLSVPDRKKNFDVDCRCNICGVEA